MVEVTKQLAMREGIGDALADGAGRAAEHFGKAELAMAL